MMDWIDDVSNAVTMFGLSNWRDIGEMLEQCSGRGQYSAMMCSAGNEYDDVDDDDDDDDDINEMYIKNIEEHIKYIFNTHKHT